MSYTMQLWADFLTFVCWLTFICGIAVTVWAGVNLIDEWLEQNRPKGKRRDK